MFHCYTKTEYRALSKVWVQDLNFDSVCVCVCVCVCSNMFKTVLLFVVRILQCSLADLEFEILLPQPPMCWDYRHVSPCQAVA
jgi:hypothetical protein